MKVFSDGLQRVAGSKLRSILKGMTKNRALGVVTGFGTTAITQSSTTTTVMVVSFVNAGLLTFIESTGVIMGANIGTTITAWMVSIFGFKFQITPIAIALIGIFFPFLFAGNIKLRNIADTMIGFGILFIGLEFIKTSVPDVAENPEMFAFLNQFTDFGFASTLIFVFFGALLTLITQSSSASTTITLVMLAQGWVTFPIAAAMILGENIGTTVTANIAALIGNTHAKRAARFHFIFNVIGVSWMLIVLTPFLNGIDTIMLAVTDGSFSVFSDDPLARTNATLALSLFHTSFNVLNVLLLFVFVPRIIKIVEKIQPLKTEGDDKFRLQFISSGMMSSPQLSIDQAHKEIQLFATIVEKMHYSFTGLLLKKQKKHRKFIKKIEEREKLTDELEIEIGEYLTSITEHGNPGEQVFRKIRGMYSILNDLERIADIYYQMSKTLERMIDDNLEFPPDAQSEIKNMLAAVSNALNMMKSNLSKNSSKIEIEEAYSLESNINNLRDTIRKSHYERLEKGTYSVKFGILFLDILNRLEKIGDHIINVSESVKGFHAKENK